MYTCLSHIQLFSHLGYKCMCLINSVPC